MSVKVSDNVDHHFNLRKWPGGSPLGSCCFTHAAGLCAGRPPLSSHVWLPRALAQVRPWSTGCSPIPGEPGHPPGVCGQCGCREGQEAAVPRPRGSSGEVPAAPGDLRPRYSPQTGLQPESGSPSHPSHPSRLPCLCGKDSAPPRSCEEQVPSLALLRALEKVPDLGKETVH